MISLILQSIENDSDREYIFEIYSKYNGMIKGKSMSILKNENDADDVVQTVVIRLISVIEKLRKLNGAQQTAYISVIVKNTAIDFYNKKRNKFEHEINYELVENQLKVEEFATKDKIDFLMIKQLDEKTAKILYEKYVEKETVKEISMRYNIPQGTVATIISRGKEKIKQYLEEEARSEK